MGSIVFADSDDFDSGLPREGVKCFHSWMVYGHRAWLDKGPEMTLLRPLTTLAITCLGNRESYEEATELFSDLLTNFSSVFTPNDYEMLSLILTGEEGQSSLSQLKDGNLDHDIVAFARLLLAYGDATLELLAKSENPTMKQILHQLLELLRCEGYAGIDDQICTQALDFWTGFVEFLTDSLFSHDDSQQPNWLESARDLVRKVIENCWVKIRIPPDDIAVTWDADERTSFKGFRMDVQDLLQSSYTLFGVDLLGRFTKIAIQSLNSQEWIELEATIFCVNAISDAVADENLADHYLSELFRSSLFGDLARDYIPAKTRSTAMNMINRYTAFFERNATFLPPMLNFLFESLKAPSMATAAAKAIFVTCSSCRKALILDLDTFLHQYQIILLWEGIDAHTKELVIGGIAAIVQALASDEERLTPLSTLVQFVDRDIDRCYELINTSQAEESQASGMCALKCLVSMAKSLQVPDDVTIDLDAEQPQSNFWYAQAFLFSC